MLRLVFPPFAIAHSCFSAGASTSGTSGKKLGTSSSSNGGAGGRGGVATGGKRSSALLQKLDAEAAARKSQQEKKGHKKGDEEEKGKAETEDNEDFELPFETLKLTGNGTIQIVNLNIKFKYSNI